MEHFYRRDAGRMTLPEFLSALRGIGLVREELRPKTVAEVHAKAVEETAKRQKAALKRKLENQARNGGGR